MQVRLEFYNDMLADPQTLKNNQWEHNVGLLEIAREIGCKVALATMSHCAQVQKILKLLDWNKRFDYVATRDDVENGKPDPEIYNLVVDELQIKAEKNAGNRRLARRG